jgi:hypothetical protein
VNGIFITSDDVSIDLNGFTLTSPDKAGSGVETDGFSDTVRVRNGTVRGFANPIRLFGSRSHVSDVRVTGFGTGTGITIGRDGVVEDCAVVLGDGDGVWIQDISVLRRCAVKQVAGSGVVASIGALVEGNSINANAFTATTYGIETVGQETTIRDNTLSNGARDIGVAFHGHVIIDNVIHCATSIVNLGTFSYWAPVNTEAHANQPAFAAGFC